MDDRQITVRGARVNNLRNVDVTVPRGTLTVVTGVSGSGKSSLAFDTLYAEGQRRYVESLSAYARQFLGRMAKPEVDFIHGLPPAIAVEQKVNTRNPRSTVGTTTEIYDYLRMLFARLGRTFSPVSGVEVKRHRVDDVVAAFTALDEGTRVAVAAPMTIPPGRSWAEQAAVYAKEGYSRLIDPATGAITDLADAPSPEGMLLLIDRLTASTAPDEVSRLTDSVETAFFEGRDAMQLLVWDPETRQPRAHEFSRRFEADGITFLEPIDALFNFNNPYGACPRCEGFGRVIGIDEELVVPDPTLSVYDDAVVCWKGEKMSEWKRACIAAAGRAGFPIHRPYGELEPEHKQWLWRGSGAWGGIDAFFDMVRENQYKIQYRVMLARYRGKTVCPACGGRRLRPEALYVKVQGKTIADLVAMPVNELRRFFDTLTPDSATDSRVAERLLRELQTRLGYLDDVGLGYLTLDRPAATLSGGESQRINLSTSLGSGLMGSLYILDEPSIGLHPRDTDRLISVLERLRDTGNTVLVVEHDEQIMRRSDWIIDVGPRAGSLGGEIVYQGPTAQIADAPGSLTADYLAGRLTIDVPRRRRRWRDKITVQGPREHNLKGEDATFPLGVMTAVTGVSGSGKSTLVRDILYKALARQLGQSTESAPGRFHALTGDVKRVAAVEFIDQNPIGKSSRSNPATYLKAWDEIRRLFAETQAARQLGLTATHFSFNAEGGRCEECKGEGTITIPMQFMADVTVTCEECHGKRFKPAVLEVRYHGKSIDEVLDMTVQEAVDFFAGTGDKRVVRRLQPLLDVGLGYVKLGQSSSTLSGGENQRVKLASHLAVDNAPPTLFIFDEPTTGLHLHDIATLLDSLSRLIERGHTVVVIEHNLDVIKTADHIVDLGPDGGDAGGHIVAQGTPEDVAANPASITGQYLRPLL